MDRIISALNFFFFAWYFRVGPALAVYIILFGLGASFLTQFNAAYGVTSSALLYHVTLYLGLLSALGALWFCIISLLALYHWIKNRNAQ